MVGHSLAFCSIQGNRNCLTRLGALQKIDRLNPTFISNEFGDFGRTYQKNMAQNLGYDVPIGVETAVIKDDMPIQQQIDKTMRPKNTALKVGFNRMIGDISDTLTGGGHSSLVGRGRGRFMKHPLKSTNDRIQRGSGIFDRIGQAVSLIESGIALKEGISDISEAGQELAFGPIGTALSNIASEKFNKNPNWRPGFDGEKHAIIDTPWGLTRANWLGPGTHVLERLERGDASVDGPNGMDAAAKKHDIAYGLARTTDDVRKADDIFLKDLSNVESSTKMKAFVMGLFKSKKLAEDVGFLDPSTFAPDIKQELSGMGFNHQMQRATHMGMGFTGYKPSGTFSAENVMMGVGLQENIREVSKFFHESKKDLSEPLKQLRNIAFSVPDVQEKVSEVIEEFLPGQQLKSQLIKMAKKIPQKKSKKGKGFSAENVMMGAGVPKQEEYSGHILAGNVPKKDSKYKFGVTGDRLAHEGIYHGIGQPGGQTSRGKAKRKRGKKRPRSQKGGQILAGIIASIVVPELIKFVGEKIFKTKKKKHKKKH